MKRVSRVAVVVSEGKGGRSEKGEQRRKRKVARLGPGPLGPVRRLGNPAAC